MRFHQVAENYEIYRVAPVFFKADKTTLVEEPQAVEFKEKQEFIYLFSFYINPLAGSYLSRHSHS